MDAYRHPPRAGWRDDLHLFAANSFDFAPPDNRVLALPTGTLPCV